MWVSARLNDSIETHLMIISSLSLIYLHSNSFDFKTNNGNTKGEHLRIPPAHHRSISDTWYYELVMARARINMVLLLVIRLKNVIELPSICSFFIGTGKRHHLRREEKMAFYSREEKRSMMTIC